MRSGVEQHIYNGERAITLSFEPYTAMLLPDIGGNLVSFKDVERGFSFLRTPQADDMDSFKSYPVVYGIPVLFPPNRYQDGSFKLNGRTYSFPINEEKTNNHLHGFLHSIPWDVVTAKSTDTESYVVLQQNVDNNHDMYRYFPHEFTFTIGYYLSHNGLRQEVRIKNTGQDPMPCMLAFHTTINVPFSPRTNQEDYKFMMTIGERWELDERMLPTGEFQPLNFEERRMNNEGISPFFEPMDNHYTAVPRNGRNYMELKNMKERVQFVYDVGCAYKNWMIWNNNANSCYFCPEPQINLVNAPNSTLSADKSGFLILNSGELWSETSRFYVECF